MPGVGARESCPFLAPLPPFCAPMSATMFLLDLFKYTTWAPRPDQEPKFARRCTRLARIRTRNPATFMPDLPEMALAHELVVEFRSVCLRMREAAVIIQRDAPSVQAALQTNVMPTAGSPGAAAKPAPLLELRAVTKTFGRVTPLAGLEASVAPGEFVTVVGPSGCGKSTLFNIVAGLEEPDSRGVLRFEGNSCHAADLLGRVSFMPQQDLLLPWRNVVDNAILALEVEGVPRAEARAKALKMLPEFGLAGFEKQYPHQLSGGMRQRVALMRTFLFERDLMLLDEPFGALDALTRAMMQRWLLDVWQKYRRTILFITHDVDEAI